MNKTQASLIASDLIVVGSIALFLVVSLPFVLSHEFYYARHDPLVAGGHWFSDLPFGLLAIVLCFSELYSSVRKNRKIRALTYLVLSVSMVMVVINGFYIAEPVFRTAYRCQSHFQSTEKLLDKVIDPETNGFYNLEARTILRYDRKLELLKKLESQRNIEFSKTAVILQILRDPKDESLIKDWVFFSERVIEAIGNTNNVDWKSRTYIEDVLHYLTEYKTQEAFEGIKTIEDALIKARLRDKFDRILVYAKNKASEYVVQKYIQ